MPSRPSLVRSIPFWVLLIASLALTVAGAWLVVDRVGRIQSGVVAQTAEGAIEVYAGPSIAIAGAVILGAGLVGLLLTLAVAAASTLRPHAVVEVVEPLAAPELFEPEAVTPERQTTAPADEAPAAASVDTASGSGDSTPPRTAS